MKRNIQLLLTSLLFFFGAHAQALDFINQNFFCIDATHFYAKISGGANFLQNIPIGETKSSFQPGFVVGGSLGYYWCNGLRLEAEYAYRRNGVSRMHFFGQGTSHSGHFRTSSVMTNLLWELPLSSWGYSFWNIRPMMGAGVGCDFQRLRSSNSLVIFDQKWTHFAWQVMTGVVYSCFWDTEISLEYKFHQGGSHFNNHSLLLGLEYKFGLNSR